MNNQNKDNRTYINTFKTKIKKYNKKNKIKKII